MVDTNQPPGLPEYTLAEVLGRGAAGTVYRGVRRATGEQVAIKVVEGAAVERFGADMAWLLTLRHANLVRVYAAEVQGDRLYLVMQLIEGGTLREHLTKVGRMRAAEAARLITLLADGLCYLHERGLVHLDVKPSNVLLGCGNWPMLNDFGVARLVGRAAHVRVSGTPAYMSPEQCLAQPADARADQYALAVLGFELLTGHRPFSGRSIGDVLRRQTEEPPPLPSATEAALSPELDRVLLRALSKLAEARFADVREFADAFARACEVTPQPPLVMIGARMDDTGAIDTVDSRRTPT